MMHILAAVALTAGMLCSQANAADDGLVRAPFETGALTPTQLAAWSVYLAEESGRAGCRYGDDPRLSEDPRGLLEKLAKGQPMEPVQVTYRTWLKMNDNIRALLSHGVRIASMACNNVYVAGEDLIGMPALPFEEYLSILADRYRAAGGDIKAVVPFLRTVKAAAIDARWFWAFFVVDRDHMRLLGLNADAMREIEAMLPDQPAPNFSNPSGGDETLSLLYRIYRKVFNQEIYITGQGCKGEANEPSDEVLVFKRLNGDTISAFYTAVGLRSNGRWTVTPQVSKAGMSATLTRPVSNPGHPFFTVTRGATVFQKERKK